MANSSGGATRGFHNRMALVFDFDRTLSSGTVDALLERLGMEERCARSPEANSRTPGAYR